MNNNLEKEIAPFISLVLDNLVTEMGEIYKPGLEISISERNSFKTYLNEISNLIDGYEELLTPEIFIKINDIKQVFESNNEGYEGEINLPLNPPLTNQQED